MREYSSKLEDINFCVIHKIIRAAKDQCEAGMKLDISVAALTDFLSYAVPAGEKKLKVDYKTLKETSPVDVIKELGEEAYNKPLKLLKKQPPQEYPFNEIHKAIRETGSVLKAAQKLNVAQVTLSNYLKRSCNIHPDVTFEDLKKLTEQELESRLGLRYRQHWIIDRNSIIYQNSALPVTNQPATIPYDYKDVDGTLDKLMETYASTLIIANSNHNNTRKHPQEYPFNEIHKAIRETGFVTKAAQKLNIAKSTLTAYLNKIYDINPDLKGKDLKEFSEQELEIILKERYRQHWIIDRNLIIYQNAALQATNQPATIAYNYEDVDGTLDKLMETYAFTFATENDSNGDNHSEDLINALHTLEEEVTLSKSQAGITSHYSNKRPNETAAQSTLNNECLNKHDSSDQRPTKTLKSSTLTAHSLFNSNKPQLTQQEKQTPKLHRSTMYNKNG